MSRGNLRSGGMLANQDKKKKTPADIINQSPLSNFTTDPERKLTYEEKKNLAPSDRQQVQAAKTAYKIESKKNNSQGTQRAHDTAQSARRNSGYTGNQSGSQVGKTSFKRGTTGQERDRANQEKNSLRLFRNGIKQMDSHPWSVGSDGKISFASSLDKLRNNGFLTQTIEDNAAKFRAQAEAEEKARQEERNKAYRSSMEHTRAYMEGWEPPKQPPGIFDRLKNIGASAVKSSASSALELAGYLDANPSVNKRLLMEGGEGLPTTEESRYSKLYSAAYAMQDSAQRNLDAAKQGLGPVGRTFVDVGTTGTQLLGDMALNMVAPGAGLAAMGARAMGGGMQQARIAGANPNQQLLYGAASASVEVATEKLSSVAAPFAKAYGKAFSVGGKNFDDLLGSAIGKVIKNPRVAEIVQSTTGEGLEEIIADAVNPVIRSIYNGNTPVENYKDEDIKNWLYDGMIGSILGAVGAGGEQLYNLRRTPSVQAPVQEAENSTIKGVIPPYMVQAQQQNSAPRTAAESAYNYTLLKNSSSSLGENGRKAILSSYKGERATDYYAGFVPYYNAGLNGKDMKSVKDNGYLSSDQKLAAYYAGKNDTPASTITNETGLNSKVKSDMIGSEPHPKKFIRAKKSDWNSTDSEWYVPGHKQPIAYSTISVSDSIGVMADDHPDSTISELRDLFIYDEEAKHVLSAYIDNGYGNQNANEWFSYSKKYGESETEDNASPGVPLKPLVSSNRVNHNEEYSPAEIVQEDGRNAEGKGNDVLRVPEHTGMEAGEDEAGRVPVHQPGPVHEEVNGSSLLADKIGSMIYSGTEFNSAWLFEQANKAFGGTMADGTYTPKDAYDAMELAVNRMVSESNYFKKRPEEWAVWNAKAAISTLENMLSKLPTQTKRTQEQQDFQQFSTPPTVSFLASWVAGVNSSDTVLEPSAGVGGLAAFPKAAGAKVIVNELSKRRLELLKSLGFNEVYNENAEQIDNILPDSVKPTVVLMNPPFSATAGRTNTKKTSNAERHIEQALSRLENGGRLVAILGKGMSNNATSFKEWWSSIRENYDIRANISLEGGAFTKYGTSWGTQLVVIDKTGPQKGETLTGTFSDLKDVPKVLEGIRNDRGRTAQSNPAVAGSQKADIQPQERKPVSSGTSGSMPDVRGSVPQSDGIVQPGRGSSNGDTRANTGLDGRPNNVSVPDRAGQRGENTGASHTTQEAGPVQNTAGNGNPVSSPDESPSGKPAAKRGDGELRPEPQRTSPVSGVQTEKVSKEEKAKVSADSVYSSYAPSKVHIKGAKQHPAPLVESAAMAAVEPPDPKYTPNLPENVIKDGLLSSAQLENVVYAGQAHAQVMGNGYRRGYFIGDGTGVGKGRQIAGIIMDNFRHGRTKAVWVTMNDRLLPDTVRDWVDLGGKKEEIKEQSKAAKLGSKIQMDSGVLFSTYGTIRTGTGEKSRVQQLVDWLGKDFDGVIAFDEAHNMGNAIDAKGARGTIKASATALAGVELQNALPNARVLYVSATGATEVKNLSYATRLGLWGPGTAFPTAREFVDKISAGGLAAMELVARDMKSMGVYMARSISFDGVEYSTVQHTLTPMQREIYNTTSRAWQIVMQNITEALEITNAENSKARGQALQQFYGSMQKFYNQVMTSMSMPSVISDIKKELSAGHSCVIQLVNTNEAAANRALEKVKEENTSLDELDLTPTDTLVSFLKNGFPVIEYEEYTDEEGNLRTRPVLDGSGNPVFNKKAVAMRDNLIARISEMKVPDGPLEILMDTFGVDKVAEVTGRSRRIVQKPDKNGNIHRVEERVTKNMIAADAQAFQDGEKHILVFSNAGGTGKSYHADLRAKNQELRIHYLLQPGWTASKAVQGLGRTHRSNQKQPPVFKLVTTDIMGQKRFVSTIARRLDQLGALTKGQRQASGGIFGERDNLENPLAIDSLALFYKDLAYNRIPGFEDGMGILQKMGLADKFTDSNGGYHEDAAVARDMNTFLNRILALEVDEQNELFNNFFTRYETALDKAIQEGTVDMGMENVKADKIEIAEEKVIRTDEETGAETKYVQVKSFTKPKIIPLSNIENLHASFKGLYRMEDGSVRASYQIADKTMENGDIVSRYKLQSPAMNKFSTYTQPTFEKLEKIEKKDWSDAWKSETEKMPEYNENTLHLLTGSLLPVWNRLPSENTRVMRVITDDGSQYLGRLIRPSQIDGVLKALGLGASKKETVSSSDIMERILKNGETVSLVGDHIKLFRRRVSGEYRIEITGDNVWYLARQYAGIIKENINYKYRYFIPTGKAGEDIIKSLVKENPVSGFSSGSTVDEFRASGTEKQGWEAERSGESKAAMPLSDIINKIAHDFGIPITNGHVRSRGTLGLYDKHARGIRTKIANNLPVVSHELGHHLDKEYDLTKFLPTEEKSELIGALSDDTRSAYPETKWLSEGAAEYTRRYLQNRETAAIDYPLFTKRFMELVPPDALKKVNDLANEVNAYYSMDAETAASSLRRSGEKWKDFRTKRESASEASDEFYQAWVDSNHAIKLFDRASGSDTYKIATNAAYSESVAYALVKGGDLYDIQGKKISGGIKEALKEINLKSKQEFADFNEYLVVKHGPERLKGGSRIFADDRKNSTAWMEGRTSELERKYPSFQSASENLYKFQRAFLETWGVKTGLVSPESYQEWGERWQYYVPLNRYLDGKGERGTKRGFSNQNSTIYRQHGSGLDIVYPMDNIVNNMVRMITAGYRNSVMREISAVASREEGLAAFLEKVPAPLQRKSVRTDSFKGDLKKLVSEYGFTQQEEENILGIVDGLDDVLIQYGRGKAHGDVVTVLRNGTPEFWKINDPLLLESVTNLSPQRLPAWLDAYGRISRFMTSNITGNNVLWSIFSNAPRDIMTFFTFSESKNPIRVFGGMAATYVNMAKGKDADPLYKEFIGMGGGRVSAYTADKNMPKNVVKELSGNKTKWLNPLEWLEYVSNMIESGPRYAYYKILRENGKTPQEAFYGAMDVTVNFPRGGVNAKSLNKVVPFFNASVQGIDKFVRFLSAEDVPVKERRACATKRTVTWIVSSAALGALMFALNGSDDDRKKEYAQLSNYIKNSFFSIPLGDGKYITIPKAREITVLTSFFETLLERYSGNQRAFDEFYGYFADNCLPNLVSDVAKGDIYGGIGSLGIIGIGAYMMSNRDFLGVPIVNQSLSKLENKDQFTQKTSKLAFYIGQAFNASPAKVDYFFQNILGGFWNAQKALFPIGDENVDKSLGIKGSYLRDNRFSTDIVNRLYDAEENAGKKHASHSDDMDAAILAQLYGNMANFYSAYNSLSRNEPESGESLSLRQDVLSYINDFEDTMDKGTKSSTQSLIESIARQAGKADLLPSARQKTFTVDGKQYNLTASQYVAYQKDYMNLYLGYAKEALEDGKNQGIKDTLDFDAYVLKSIDSMAADDAQDNVLAALNGSGTKHIPSNGNVEGVPTGAYIRMKANMSLLTPFEGKEEVSTAQKYYSVGSTSYDEPTKEAMIKSMMTEKSGEVKTGYVKYQVAKSAGMSTKDYFYVQSELTKLTPEEGKDDVSDYQKYVAIGAMSQYTEDQKDILIKAAMTDGDGVQKTGYAKYQSAKKAGISTQTYFTVKKAASSISKGYHKNGESLENSSSLMKLEAIYNSGVTLTTAQWNALYDDIEIGKKVRGWSPALVRQKLAYFRSIADDYKQ